MKYLLYLLLLGVALNSCRKEEPPSPDPEPSLEVVEANAHVDLEAYQAGKELFMTHCFFCHGKQADGNGPLVPSLDGPEPRNFTLPGIAEAHPDSLKRVILEGGEAFGFSSDMPAWSSVLSNAEAEVLVAFIQAVSQEGGLLPNVLDPLNVTGMPVESKSSY